MWAAEFARWGYRRIRRGAVLMTLAALGMGGAALTASKAVAVLWGVAVVMAVVATAEWWLFLRWKRAEQLNGSI